MIWLTFLGAGLVLRYGGHIGIDTLHERFPRQAPALARGRRRCMLGFFAFMAVDRRALRVAHVGPDDRR